MVFVFLNFNIRHICVDMTEEQKRRKYFKKVFNTYNPSKKDVKAALDKAHEIRQFEITLYWRRSLFFWTFTIAFFGGYFFTLDINASYSESIFIQFLRQGICIMGFFTSVAWLYTEKGSEAWKHNWELHIDYLETDVTGNLHKTRLGDESDFYSLRKILKSFVKMTMVAWGVLFFLPLISSLFEMYLLCIFYDYNEFAIEKHLLHILMISFLVLFMTIFMLILLLMYLFCEMVKGWKTSSCKEKTEEHGFQRLLPLFLNIK